jgi:hypothetical protein
MKEKITSSLVAVVLLLLTYGLGYWNGFSHAQKGVRVVVARDTSDRPQSSGKAEYEPYLTRQNAIPDKAQ